MLKAGRFRRAVILPNSFRAAMVAFAAGIGERWGYSTDARGMLLTHGVRRDPSRGHQLDDYSMLLAAMNAPRVVDEIPTMTIPLHVRERAGRLLRDAGVRLDEPLFGLHAGGLYGRAKHWGDRPLRRTGRASARGRLLGRAAHQSRRTASGRGHFRGHERPADHRRRRRRPASRRRHLALLRRRHERQRPAPSRHRARRALGVDLRSDRSRSHRHPRRLARRPQTVRLPALLQTRAARSCTTAA